MREEFGARARSAFLALLLLLCAFIIAPGVSVADQDGDYVYELEGSPAVAVVTGYTGAGGDITIPAELGGYVTGAIGASAFFGCTSLTSVTVPDSVTSIGDSAFIACTFLTSVTLPDSVTSIGDWAFSECTSLTSVTIGNGVISIGEYAFSICTSLTSVTIPDSVTSIGDGAFSECSSLISVTIGNAVTSIGDRAFSWCASLTSATLPDSVTSIGGGAFSSCTSLTSVTIGNGVTSIGDWAFNTCTFLTSITFLGLVAPTQVGEYWIMDTDPGIRGHAYAASDFPALGETFHGLVMGEVIAVAGSPGPPQSLIAVAGDSQVTLTWTAPANDGGNSVTGYKVYRGFSSGAENLLTTLGNVTTYTDTDLTSGEVYYYRVSALNSVGEGLLSEEVVATPKAPIADEGSDMMLIIFIVAVIAILGVGVALFYKWRK